MRALNCLLLFLLATNSHAVEIELPTETAVYRPSKLPGYQLVQKNCLACHSAQYVTTQPPDSTRKYWLETVHKMQKVFGAPIDDKEIPAMVDYLVQQQPKNSEKR